MSIKIDTIEEHIGQAGAKLKDLAEIHLPAIEEFIAKLGSNPLVIAFESVLPGGLGEDTMAILNALAPILAAMGKRPAQPDPAPGDAQTGSPAGGEGTQL